MNNKRRSFVLIWITLICLLIIGLFSIFSAIKPVAANADSQIVQTAGNDLHTQSKITQQCTDEPAITVLTPGLGCRASVWSNDPYNYYDETLLPKIDKNGITIDHDLYDYNLQYNSASLISAIGRELNDNYDLYYSVVNSDSYVLYKLDLNDYSYETNFYDNKVDHISTTSKHIVLLFESSTPNSSNQAVYEQLDYVLDDISIQYKDLSGKLPRYSLVGHSRGGLTNIQYAIEHPYNVAALFSMGTPYSGSTLGQIEPVMGMLNMMQEENGEWHFTNDGAEDIMNAAKAIELRDAWNSVFTPDVNINVVTYGTMVSLDYIRLFIEDVSANPEFGGYIEDYVNILNIVIDFIEEHPYDTQRVLNFVSGIAEIFNAFSYDIVGNITDGTVTTEEVQEIIRLYNVINDEVVLMDDLFIDVNSQLGYGFEDGNSYNGFKRYVNIFGEDDFMYGRAQPTQPAVAHNLETMNGDYIYSISKSLVYGKTSASIPVLNDNTSGTIPISGSHAMMFTPSGSGNRKITVPNARIQVYKINANNNFNLQNEGRNELIYNFISETTYLIVFSEISQTANYNFSINDNISFGNNSINIASQDTRSFRFIPQYSGYYIIENSSVNIEIILDGIAKYDSSNMKYYVYLEEDSIETITLKNKSSSIVNFSLKISAPPDFTVNQDKKVTSGDKVFSFTNPYEKTIEFQLILTWQSGVNIATIYRNNNIATGSIVSYTNKRTTTFTLSPNEICYIIYSTQTEVSAIIQPSQNQIKWKINGTYMSNDVELPRGESYTIQLVLYKENKELDSFTGFSGFFDEEFIFVNNVLEITYSGEVGNYIVIIPLLYPEYPLKVTAGEGREDIDYIVTFDKTGGSGGSSSIIANYNRDMPSAVRPSRTGYIFRGYFSEQDGEGVQYYDSSMKNMAKWNKEQDAVIYAYWEPIVYTITYNLSYGTNPSSNPKTYTIETPTFTLKKPIRTGYKGEWSKPTIYKGTTGNLTVTFNWQPIEYRVIINHAVYDTWEPADNGGDQSYQFYLKYNQSKTITAKSLRGYTFKYWVYYNTSISGTNFDFTKFPILSYDATITIRNLTAIDGDSMDVVACYAKNSCIATGTLITLADGSQKPVELLNGDEMLLVWNMYTGTFDSAPILCIDNDPLNMYEVIQLSFSDGTTVDVISEHGFFDIGLNKYVYLDEHAADYIGHCFLKQGTNGMVQVTLEDVTIVQESTTAYSPVTFGHAGRNRRTVQHF